MRRRRRREVDWYVEMSEWLERREQRRKWVILGTCVAVPLLLIGAFAVGAWLLKLRKEDRLPGLGCSRAAQRPPQRVKRQPLGPLPVKSLHKEDVNFSQLDASGMVTTIIHVFRELRPQDEEGNFKDFTVNREDERHGTVALYRLSNRGTGEVEDFHDVPVQEAGEAGWAISERGWRQIRDQLQVQMKVRLGRIP